ncbi:MAG: Na+/H+ antiporter NhaC family protein [bacterium]|nr:Na+/H+ antiporter NhaC family protein [bacterium]
MESGILSLLPPLIAITLCIVTRQVILSLFLGVASGLLIYTGGSPIVAFRELTEVLVAQTVDDWNARVILFTVLLGGITGIVQVSGGFQAFGAWAGRVVRSARGARLTAWFAGLILFFDDYFDCLTSGSVVRPITDEFRVSREKLAYLVDVTAAPICTVIPLSTWAAYMMGLVASEFSKAGVDASPFATFLASIPFNFYALAAVLLALFIAVTGRDFGPMARAEHRARTTGAVLGGDPAEVTGQDILMLKPSAQGKVSDLFVPIVTLVVAMLIGLLYTGGLFEGATVMEAIGDADAATAMIWATILAAIVAFIWYVPRRVVTLADFMRGFVQGFKAMIPALAILVLAWSIGDVTDRLGLGEYVANTVGQVIVPWLVPMLVFVVSSLIAFSTGTSWGTFAIMMPVAMPLAFATGAAVPAAVGAVFAGGVFGDHCSPISDTTILSSTGSSCNHIDHVYTQLPYALLAAGIAAVGFIVGGLLKSPWLALVLTLAALALVTTWLSKAAAAKSG